MNHITPNPSESQQSYVNLSPETRELLAELYGAWMTYQLSRSYIVPFTEWLLYTAGNLWLDSARSQPDNAAPANGGQS